ncbi:hypothetical protein [Teichococcus deserti]|uniref:hypothetical protein n=1 Tax=Teichococcus deserti TaxID=1817963 RepID=UPI0010569868|nr:hypothetical protein [Pseudoroseomonas deserti]
MDHGEPMLSQIPTSEVKRILTDRFSRDVAAAAGQRIWRGLTIFGLPGLVLAGTLVWGTIEQAVERKVRDAVQPAVDRAAQPQREMLRLELRDFVTQSFIGQQGAALQNALAAATKEAEFTGRLAETVNREMNSAWSNQSEALRTKFLEQIKENRVFREQFARDVEKVLTEGGGVSRIITDALSASVRQASPNESSHEVALALLAAVNQNRANEVVRDILRGSREQRGRDIALQALSAVSFSGSIKSEISMELLTLALSVWREHCAIVRCTPERTATRAMAAFLGQGRELDAIASSSWVTSLYRWHEEVLANDAPYRSASIDLIPTALVRIGTPDAVGALTHWLTMGNAELSRSAARAVAVLPDTALATGERLHLFRTIWARLMAPGAELRSLSEAGTMALGVVSRGRAEPSNAFGIEAELIRSLLPHQQLRGQIQQWASRSRRPSQAIRSDAVTRLPDSPCVAVANVALEEDVDHITQIRTDICALAALMRPEDGEREWNTLRAVTRWQGEGLATLGLIWAIAASRMTDDLGVEAKQLLAPTADLLMSRSPTPAVMQLAAMTILRTAPSRVAWEALEDMGTGLANPRVFLAASSRLFSSVSREELGWIAQRIQTMPDSLRNSVFKNIADGLINFSSAETTRETTNIDSALARMVTALATTSPPVSALNGLRLSFLIDPNAVLNAVERRNGLTILNRLATGPARLGGVRPADASTLLDDLLAQAGWPNANRQELTIFTLGQASLQLGLAQNGQFGRLQIDPLETVFVDFLDAAAKDEVTFYNPSNHQVRVLKPGEPWFARSQQEEDEEIWLVRTSSQSGNLRLKALEKVSLSPARASEVTISPTVESGRVYVVDGLPSGQDGALSRRFQGWIRIDGLRRGQALHLTTFGLGKDVDTIIAVERDGHTLDDDDDGGDERLSSSLRWTADRDGSVYVRLENIGDQGQFRFMVQIRDPRG